MIEAKSLSYSYDGKTVLHYPDIQCERGKSCLLLGASGSGKTTLLHMLAGLLSPAEGSILFDGKDIVSFTTAEMDSFRGKEIGIVFQRPHFVNALSVIDNLCLAQRLAEADVDKSSAQELLNRLNIGHKANASVRALSQGEKQRVAIARALINKPGLILADEPTSALDDHNAQEVLALLQEVASEAGASLLIVTHDNRLTEVIDQKVILSVQDTKSKEA